MTGKMTEAQNKRHGVSPELFSRNFSMPNGQLRGIRSKVQPETLLDQIKKEVSEYSIKSRMLTWHDDRVENAEVSNHSQYQVSYFIITDNFKPEHKPKPDHELRPS